MSTPDLERRVALTLKQHAEDVMNRTDTSGDKLERVLADGERAGRKQRGAWIAAAAAAVVAVALVVWALSLIVGKPEAAKPLPAGPVKPEQVAAQYVLAYGSYDRATMKSLSADDALATWPSMRHDNLADEAIEFRVLLKSCKAVDRSEFGTRVNCAYDVHALGSEQLGRGPYSNNFFFLTVKDGKVIRSQRTFDFANNGFAGEVWEPFQRWVEQHYPNDAPAMFDDSNDPRPEAASATLFHRHIADYLAAQST